MRRSERARAAHQLTCLRSPGRGVGEEDSEATERVHVARVRPQRSLVVLLGRVSVCVDAAEQVREGAQGVCVVGVV